MASSSLSKQLKSLRKKIDALEVKVEAAKKPKSIDECTSKKQLKHFTVKQLTDWLKKNNIDIEKLTRKHKEDLIKVIWKSLEEDFSSDSGESESDSSDSDSDSDSDSE